MTGHTGAKNGNGSQHKTDFIQEDANKNEEDDEYYDSEESGEEEEDKQGENGVTSQAVS